MRPSHALIALVLSASPVVAPVAAAPAGAKAMFRDPSSVQFVGIQYWFTNDRGDTFASPGAAGVGAHLTMHVRSNVVAFLTVWMSDATHPSVELTPRTDAGPAGQWTGDRVRAGEEFVVPVDLVVTSPDRAQHVLVLLARSQTEQVDSVASCREKLQRIAGQTAADGDAALVQEVDERTVGQIGTYVVHRTGGQAGAEIVIAR